MGGIASAGRGTKTNGSQFFVTLVRAPTLDGKHTIFGKITGNTIYNLGRIGDVEVDKKDRPVEPPRIIRAELTWDPFGDLEPRYKPEPPLAVAVKDRPGRAPVHNKRVLSFVPSDAEDEEDAGKETTASGKSAHDLLNDPKLSREAAYKAEQASTGRRKSTSKAEERESDGGRRRGDVASKQPEAREKGTSNRKDRKGHAPTKIDKQSSPSSGSDASMGSDDEEQASGIAAERERKRLATIASLKRDIAGMSTGDAAASEAGKSKKAKSALAEQRQGYTKRGATKFQGRAERRKGAHDVEDNIKSFQDRLRAFASSANPEEDEEKAAEEAKPSNQPEDKEEGTFSAVWDEGDEESTKDWLGGGGLKFHVSADKAFKLESMKARDNLEIFDPLAARGNDEVLAEERKRRAEQMRPTLRRKEPMKKW